MNANPSPNLARGAWLAVALLFPVALLNYLDRQMLAAMKDSVMAAIPDVATDARWGLLGAWFKWIYAGLSPIGGFVADRLSKRWTVIASLAVWSAVTWWLKPRSGCGAMKFSTACRTDSPPIMGSPTGSRVPAAVKIGRAHV